MGVMRYQVIKVEEYGSNQDHYKVTRVKGLTDDTNLEGLIRFCEAFARTETDRRHRVHYAVLPWFDADADVHEQPTICASPPVPRIAAPVTISEAEPDVSELVTARLILPTKAS